DPPIHTIPLTPDAHKSLCTVLQLFDLNQSHEARGVYAQVVNRLFEIQPAILRNRNLGLPATYEYTEQRFHGPLTIVLGHLFHPKRPIAQRYAANDDTIAEYHGVLRSMYNLIGFQKKKEPGKTWLAQVEYHLLNRMCAAKGQPGTTHWSREKGDR